MAELKENEKVEKKEEKEKEEKKDDNGTHAFLFRVPKAVWNRFVETLPESISANEKLERIVLDYLIEYERVMGIAGNDTASKNRQKE